MSRSSPETETLLQEASFAARVDRISSGETKMVYVKRWRTLVELPAKYADEIVEALRTSGVAQIQRQPVTWQRRFRSSTTDQWGEWESSRISEEEFRYKFDYLIKSGECEVRYLYAAISDSSTDRQVNDIAANSPGVPKATIRKLIEASARPLCLCCEEVEVEKDGDECERCHVTYAQSSPERK